MKTDVTFRSNGLALAANLYVPEGAGKRPAVVVGHPASGVKEQTAGLYARLLAERGFVALAFDTATQGESEGLPRGVEDGARRVEELKDAVSFLSVRAEVDPARIGALGICASGGYVIPATVTDHRIKAVATVSGVDLGTWYRRGADGNQDPSVLHGMLDAAAEARTAEARGSAPKTFPIQPASEADARAAGPQALDGWEYYCGRGAHPRSAKEFTWTSIDRTAAFEAFRFIAMIAPRPLLMIVGTEAVTRWMGEAAIADARAPKELYWIDGATHCGLYDKPPYVAPAVEKLATFFDSNLCQLAREAWPCRCLLPWWRGPAGRHRAAQRKGESRFAQARALGRRRRGAGRDLDPARDLLRDRATGEAEARRGVGDRAAANPAAREWVGQRRERAPSVREPLP